MTLADLRAQIEGHAPGSLIPRDWLLDQIGDVAGDLAWYQDQLRDLRQER